MERFSSIYPFTTENIAGYMSELDLKGKKVITVTGSTDHIINAIVCGTTDITYGFKTTRNKKFIL